MRAVIQRADEASAQVEGNTIGDIDFGLVVFLGVTHNDTQDDAAYLANKIINLRIFEDSAGKMNHSLKYTGGGLLSISQFTLYGDTRKGRRPSFVEAAPPQLANELYESFNQMIEDEGIRVEKGQFGEMMHVKLTNTGPVTLILDSKDT